MSMNADALHRTAATDGLAKIDAADLTPEIVAAVVASTGNTLAHVAARKHELHLLIERGLMTQTLLTVRNARGNTVVHIAASNGQIAALHAAGLLKPEHLLVRNEQHGATPIHVATRNGYLHQLHSAGMLSIEHLAVRDNLGQTPVHDALNEGRPEQLRDLGLLEPALAFIGDSDLSQRARTLHAVAGDRYCISDRYTVAAH